jgi:vitamin B12 transporter
LILLHPGPARRALVAAGLSLAAASTLAQSAPVVVTGAREPAGIDRLVADIALIARDTIEASTADSVADLLRREAGIQLSRNGGPGQSTGILLRGAASVNTVVLVDGVRIGSATLGYAQLDALSLSTIERIEVLRGPGSSLYGADAVGGVVQIITRRGAPGTQLAGEAGLGGFGSRNAVLSVGGASAQWDYALTAGRERSDGVSAIRPNDAFGNHNPDKDGHSLTSGQARIGWRPAAGHRIGLTLLRTRLNAQYDASEYAPPSYAQDSSPDFRNRLATDVAALDWRGAYGPNLSATVHAAHSVDDLRSGGTLIDRFRTVRDHVTAQLAWKAGAAGELVAAIEHLQEKASSTSYVADVSRRNDALVLALTGAASAWSWQADLRHDDNADYGGVTTARLGAGFRLAPGLKLRALGGTSFRAPSFNELYFPGYGVATLRPERGRSVELGVDWRAGTAHASATLFRNRLRSLIGYESNPANCPDPAVYNFGCARNLSQAQLQGLTLDAGHEHGDLALRGHVEWLDAKDKTTGTRLARRAAHQASASADWRLGDWTLGASVLRLGARPDGGATLAAETTLDLSATWRIAPRWTVQAKALNVIDTDIQPVRDYQGLGRQGWLLLRYQGTL